MKKKLILIPFFYLICLSGCKKDHTCYCPDPLIDQSGFIIHDTKNNAEKECEETVNPFNETKCGLIATH